MLHLDSQEMSSLNPISTHSALATTASRALPICESVKGNSGIDQNGFYLPETLFEFVIEGPSDSSKSTSNLFMKFSLKIEIAQTGHRFQAFKY